MKHRVNLPFTGTGFVGLENGYELHDEDMLTVVVENVASDNVLQIQGTIENAATWTPIYDIVGPGEFLDINIANYDKIRYTVSSYSASGTPKLVTSGFWKSKKDGVISSHNSTTTPLGVGATFTGTAIDVIDYALIFVTVHTDVASATDGLCLQVSNDGSTWYDSECFSVAANSNKTYSFQADHKYIRTKYVNGGTIQTAFELNTILKRTNSKPSSHRISDNIVGDDDATLNKSVLTAERTSDNLFVNINASPSGNLQTTNAEDGLAIAKGEVAGTSFVHKFGDAPDFDIGDGFVTVWDGANDAGLNAMQYTYSSTADITRLSSSAAGDTTDIEVQGLDANLDPVTQTITLNGQTPVTLSTTLLRVFRLKNVGSTDIVGQVYCYTSAATVSSGVPSPTNAVRAIINNGNNQTLMAVYTIPNGKTGYMRDWYASSSSSRGGSVHQLKLVARPQGQVFQLKHKSAIAVAGTSYIHHKYEEPEIFTAGTDLEMRANTDTNLAGVSAGFDIVLIDD
jgi:hypothetical protein